jgi:gluconate 5-dehydrogenase
MDKSNRTSLFDLTGSRALITGSSRGIGFALAKGLAEAGAAIVLNGRDRDKLERAAGELRKEGFTIATAVFDVSEHDVIESSIDKIESEIGVIDILVNNVGIVP